MFATLEAEDFIQRDIDGRAYSPGRRLRHMSAGILSSLRIRTARIAILAQLADQIGETCNIALPDRDAMIYLDRIETKWPLRIQLPVGTRVPLHCTATGKLYLSSLRDQHLKSYLTTEDLPRFTPNTITDPKSLMAEITKVREIGYAIDDEEFMEGMIAMAVPILDVNQRLVSAVSFHAPSQRMKVQDALKNLGLLKHAAKALSEIISK